MAFKLIGCALLIFACFFTGCLKAKKLYSRRDFLTDFLSFLTTLKTNIRYSGEDIFTLLEATAEGCGTLWLSGFSLERGDPESAWHRRVNALYDFVDKTDRQLLLDFGSKLGKTDLEGQLSHIERYETLFELRLENAVEEIAKKSKLYRAMGLFIGISAALLMM